MTFQEIYEKHGDEEFSKFDRISIIERPYDRPDICAFVLLNSLVPGETNIVSAAEHDQIYLGVSLEDLDNSNASDEDKINLIRCGVFADEDSLSMFV